MTGDDRHIYLVGDFFAKYWGESLDDAPPGAPVDYNMHPYDLQVNHARFVENPDLPPEARLNDWRPDLLHDVVIHFDKDPAGYGKPFREDLREARVVQIRLEGVVKERKRTFGTLRGKLYARLHTTVMPARHSEQ